jgi:hypothetical protein
MFSWNYRHNAHVQRDAVVPDPIEVEDLTEEQIETIARIMAKRKPAKRGAK